MSGLRVVGRVVVSVVVGLVAMLALDVAMVAESFGNPSTPAGRAVVFWIAAGLTFALLHTRARRRQQ